jgi:hypothetical protein
MNEQHADVTALSLHPGVGPTGLGKVRTWDIVRVFWDIVRVFLCIITMPWRSVTGAGISCLNPISHLSIQ